MYLVKKDNGRILNYNELLAERADMIAAETMREARAISNGGGHVRGSAEQPDTEATEATEATEQPDISFAEDEFVVSTATKAELKDFAYNQHGEVLNVKRLNLDQMRERVMELSGANQ